MELNREELEALRNALNDKIATDVQRERWYEANRLAILRDRVQAELDKAV